MQPATANQLRLHSSAATQAYAYLVRWQSLPAVQMLAALLKQKVRVRAAEKPFEVEGKTYPSGTLIVTRAGNERFGDRLDALVTGRSGCGTRCRLHACSNGFCHDRLRLRL